MDPEYLWVLHPPIKPRAGQNTQKKKVTLLLTCTMQLGHGCLYTEQEKKPRHYSLNNTVEQLCTSIYIVLHIISNPEMI